jgi:hypothetical protein
MKIGRLVPLVLCLVMAPHQKPAHATYLVLPPLFAQGVGALVQPGGIEGLAQKPPRPGAVQAPEGGNEPPAADQGNAEPQADAAKSASPFEIRYLISYVLMLLFIGGSTVLIIRPSGRTMQGDPGGAAKAKGKK